MAAELNPNLDVTSPDLVAWERHIHGGRTRPIDRDALFANLCEIHEVFDDYGIRHWLSHGTILGVYREGNFIPWDDDADIGLDFVQRESKNYRLALNKLGKLGFYIPPSIKGEEVHKDNAPWYDLHAIKNGEKVEGWFFEKIGEHYIYDQPRCGNVLKHDAKYYIKLGEIDFKGVKFNTPDFLEEYLVMMYGKDWKIPDPNKKYNLQS